MNDIIAGDPAPTNPAVPVEPSERDQLMFMMLHGGAASAAIAAWRVDRFASEVREQARAEVPAEALARGTRAVHALKSPAPEGSKYYRSGWEDGVDASVDAVREAIAEAGESRG